MNPFTPKTDHNLNSPHGINAPTNMVLIRIKENLNWRKTSNQKRNVTSNSQNEAKKKHILISWEDFSAELGSS